MKPLVSILIPAYNAESLIAYTLQSAIAQTWERKEIIVVDDGSRDRTAEVARRFASNQVKVVSIDNQGAAAARNYALQLSQGDYIQWLDADDLMSAEKVQKQLAALREPGNRRILLSSSWAVFSYRTHGARFTPSPLWQDLSPVEWLLRKMGKDLHMQTATWLTSRELTEAAGPWDARLHFDDDGEYFCRVLLASEGTHFVPEARVFYRVTGSSRVSNIGASNKKKSHCFSRYNCTCSICARLKTANGSEKLVWRTSRRNASISTQSGSIWSRNCRTSLPSFRATWSLPGCDGNMPG